MEKFIENIEPEHRFCPICDKEIKQGSPLHKCTKKKLKEIETHYSDFDEGYEKDDRTLGDRLQEFEEQYDNEQYYEQDNEEE